MLMQYGQFVVELKFKNNTIQGVLWWEFSFAKCIATLSITGRTKEKTLEGIMQ